MNGDGRGLLQGGDVAIGLDGSHEQHDGRPSVGKLIGDLQTWVLIVHA